MKKRPPYLHRERSRHGKVKWYVRRDHGLRTPLAEPYDTDAFWAEYRAALEGSAAPAHRRATRGTLRWAIDRYRAGSTWAGYSNATRRQHEAIFRKVVETAGDEPLSRITAKTIIAGRERRKDHPHAANNFLKAMRAFFKWAADEKQGGLVDKDPTLGVKLLKGENDDDGFHTWTEEEVERFEQHWPLGTRERLALDLLLYTGLRRGDVVRLGRQHVRNGIIEFRAEKNSEAITIPVLPPRQASIDGTKTGDLAFLVTAHGTPFVKESFGNWFRKACTAAGCPGAAHGLRKAGATRSAENGASERQLMAIFGWKTNKMAALYTKKAERKKLSLDAAVTLLPGQSQNVKRPHLRSGAGVLPKSPKKSGR
ncbi:integrase [Kaistia algarum]|uniref:tyrosine-type recombinase/integrase n=1 Tax=Kaistia algarum TaxID=2083279 RepID=UPI000CE92C9A|nr:tyrosine-type recombinase/integrase [Kaistia algarum]MCX5513741.1 tyrosine-type recombinase/integrase [Kaistia algarum]PPE79388.1 integrase [Kaistia algarum]